MGTENKTVNMSLAGVCGNPFAIMGTFITNAKAQGWTHDEIWEEVDEAMNGDYDHLLRTILNNTCSDKKGNTIWKDMTFRKKQTRPIGLSICF